MCNKGVPLDFSPLNPWSFFSYFKCYGGLGFIKLVFGYFLSGSVDFIFL